MRAIVLGLCCWLTCAQAAIRVDLRGPWRHTSEPCTSACAAPDYDDSGWSTFTLRPRAPLPPSGWARLRVELPAEASQESLAITLGNRFHAYELYVEGHRLATIGGFPSAWKAEVPRTRTFDLPPALTAGKSVIVVAIHYRATRPPRSIQAPDDGYYVLTTASELPTDLGLQTLAVFRVSRSPQIVFMTLFFVIGLASLLAWRSDPLRREFLWFAAACAARGIALVNEIRIQAPDAHPFNEAGLAGLNGVFFLFANAWYAEFALAALGAGRRWMHPVLWAAFLYSSYRVYFASDLNVGLAFTVMTGAVVMVLAGRHLWKNGRSLTWPERVFVVLLTLPGLDSLESRTQQVFGITLESQRVYRVGEYQVERGSLAFVLLCAAIFALMVRRIAADRREQRRLAGEFEAASQVQQFLLGAASGAAEVVYEPAGEVGGDFYYTTGLDEGGQLVVVGDVSGKGLKAAMVVSLITGLLDRRRSDAPGAVLAELNESLAARLEGGFVTCCAVRLDDDGRAIVANAGHPAPYADGREVELEAGLPLGLAAGVDYAETVVVFAEQLTLVSDGVVEAASSSGELFGFERTAAISTRSAKEIAEAAKQWGQNDDITVVTVRRMG